MRSTTIVWHAGGRNASRFSASVLDHQLTAAFLDAWTRLELAAQAAGGALRVQDVPDKA